MKLPLPLFFFFCSLWLPSLYHLIACFLLNPCPWVFPNVSTHFKHQLTSSEESAENPHSKQLFVSYTPADLFPALRLIKRSLWPVNNAVDLLINLPLVGRSEYSNAYICLIYKNEQRWCWFLELRTPEERVWVTLTLSLSLVIFNLWQASGSDCTWVSFVKQTTGFHLVKLNHLI